MNDITAWRKDHHLFDTGLELATSYNSIQIRSAVSSPYLMQDQLFQRFKDTIAPPQPDILPLAMRSYATWLNQLPKLTGTDLLLDTAIRAVTLVHIGRLHNSELCINESRPYYGKALRLLNKAIIDKEKSMSNVTLCATMLLSFYEMFASDDDASWVRHAGGASTLMKMRGPDRHRTGFDREIFLSYRHTLIIEAFSKDVPSFLNEPVWRQLSEDIHQDILTDGLVPPNRLVLFEIVEKYNQQLAVLTQVSAEAFQLCQPRNNKTPKVTPRWFTAYTNLKDAQEEMHRIFSSLKEALSNQNLLPKPFQTQDPIVPINYAYPNVFVSVNHVGFWTTQMLCNLHRLLLGSRMINDPLPPSSSPSSIDLSLLPAELIALEQQSTHFSLECCRSVNHMLKSSFLGPFFAVYAMRLASRHLPPGGPLWKWTIAKLYQIGERHMMFARHVPTIEEYEKGRDASRGVSVVAEEEEEGVERDNDDDDDNDEMKMEMEADGEEDAINFDPISFHVN